jgi:hypothetical protein
MTDLERLELALRRVIDRLNVGPMGAERTYVLIALMDEISKMNSETHTAAL